MASQERGGELGWAWQERFTMENEWMDAVGKSLRRGAKSTKDHGPTRLERKLRPGSGAAAATQVVAKKALIGRAGFEFINMGKLGEPKWLS